MNVVNVDLVAERRGIQAKDGAQPQPRDLLEPDHRAADAAKAPDGSRGTIAPDGPHIVSIDEVWVDVPPSEGYLLLVENRDRPGMIGAVGTLMGEFGVNISYMNVGRHEKSGNALMVHRPGRRARRSRSSGCARSRASSACG